MRNAVVWTKWLNLIMRPYYIILIPTHSVRIVISRDLAANSFAVRFRHDIETLKMTKKIICVGIEETNSTDHRPKTFNLWRQIWRYNLTPTPQFEA